MEQPKKKSKAQLENEIASAIVFVPKKGAKTLRLDDRGITFTVTDDYTVVSTNYHRHVFSNYNSEGVVYIPYFVGAFIEIFERYKTFGRLKDDKGNVIGFSFQKFMQETEGMLTRNEEVIIRRVDSWSLLISEPLYSLAPSDISELNRNIMFLSYLAKNGLLLAGHKDDLMYNDAMNKYISTVRYLSLDNDVNCEGLEEEILKIESEAMDKLQAFVESKGITWVDKVAIAKREDENAEIGA